MKPIFVKLFSGWLPIIFTVYKVHSSAYKFCLYSLQSIEPKQNINLARVRSDGDLTIR